MDNIKVLIAEDNKEVRDQFIDNLKFFAEKNFINPDYFSITSAESFSKALQIITESSTKKNYFDVFFADIDFTEDGKGGKPDSGYELIERMFDVCPITFICTHSGQFHAKELWSKYEELKGKGLILLTMDKSHGNAGEYEWFCENLTNILNVVKENKFLWDIWQNHKNIIKKLSDIKLDEDQFENIAKINSIINNLDSTLTLLRNKDRFDAKIIIYRLIIYLYHNSLEIFCRGNLSDNEVIERSNVNRKKVEDLIGRSLQFTDKISSIRTIVSYSSDRISQFGFKLNDYRNKAIHQNEKFKIEFENILFANLTLSTYVLNKEVISYNSFESNLSNTQLKSVNDLKLIIKYLKGDGS